VSGPETPGSVRVEQSPGVARRVGRVLRVALVVGVVVALLATVTAVVVPGVRAVARAPFVLADALGAPAPRPWAPSVQRGEGVVADVVVDRYASGSSARPVLLVPGAAPAGRDDARVVSLATSLARADRDVVVPELSLYDQVLDLDDVDRVVRVAQALCRPGRGLVVFGFSFGGFLALVAAADERIAECVDLVATFGAYADLVGVVQAAATGASVVDGERYPWRGADEDAARQVLRDAAVELVPAPQREQLHRALDEGDPSDLPTGSRAAYELVTAEDPRQVRALVRELPPLGRRVLDGLSPVAVADRIAAPVLAAHAVDDPAVPYAELLRLEGALPGATTMTVESFRHVDLSLSGDVSTLVSDLVSDLVTAWRLMAAVLRPQERWPWESES